MQPLLFALGVFVFVAVSLLILRYTTYLSNTKKRPVSVDVEHAPVGDQVTSR